MPNFIDRRLNPKDRSLGNRQRFIKRVHDEFKRAINDQVKSDRIADVDAAHGVPVPEPIFALTAADELGHGYVVAAVAGETLPKRLLTAPAFATAIACSSPCTLMIGATGPNDSFCAIAMSLVTSTNTCGGTTSPRGSPPMTSLAPSVRPFSISCRSFCS